MYWRKKVPILIIVLTMLLVVSFLTVVWSQKEKVVNVKKTVNEKEPEKKDIVGKEYYLQFIGQIEDGLHDSFQAVTTEELEISSIFNYGAKTDLYDLGYGFVDLDSDGVYELLLGENAAYGRESRIYGIYTFRDGKIHLVAKGEESNFYFLCENGVIVKEASKGTPYAYYSYKDGQLELIEALIYDKERDSVQPWFYNTKEVSSENAEPVRIARVCEIINSYVYMDIEYTPFEDINETSEKSTEITDYVDNEEFTFADLEGVEFCFSGGAGAWSTTVTIGADGSFQGMYLDSSTEGGYLNPNGSDYKCIFQGSFSSLVKTGSYEYTMRCESLELEEKPGTTKIVDNTRFIYSDPYGFDDAEEFKLYLPGKDESELPESFISWANGEVCLGHLSCYGLFNVNGKEGFFGQKKEELPELYDYSSSNPTKFPVTTLPAEKIRYMQKKYEDKEDLSFIDWGGGEYTALRYGYGANVDINEDGTFYGCYSSEEPDLTGVNYPNGTRYECHFSGRFSTLRKTHPYEYCMKCENLEVEGKPGEERIVDGVRIITTEPYGFCNAEEFILYLPGKRTLELPEEFLKWNYNYWEDGVQNDYILYNEREGVGFVHISG